MGRQRDGEGGEGLTRAMLLADWTMSERMRCRIMCEPVEGSGCTREMTLHSLFQAKSGRVDVSDREKWNWTVTLR